MKCIKTILFIYLLFHSMLFNSQNNLSHGQKVNDILEMGLKGNVKHIKSYVYFKTDLDDWSKRYDNNILSEKEYFFNEDGNIFKVIQYETVESYTYTFKFENGIKKSYKKSQNSNDSLIESGKFAWVNNKTYRRTSTTNNGIVHEYYFHLNKNNRIDSGSVVKYNKKGKKILEGSYVDVYKDNIFREVLYKNFYIEKDKQTTYTEIIGNRKYDDYHNLIEFTAKKNNSDTYQLHVKEISYNEK
ncbi:MAG: hypothetical protein ACK5MZ_05805 [Aestuariibaculum sp.]